MRRRLLALSVFATALLAAAASADETILFEGMAGECPVTVEANPTWHVLTVRRSPESYESGACLIDREDTAAILEGAFAALTQGADRTAYTSVFLGRIEYYDWLSRHLVERAQSHADWSAESGQTRQGRIINDLVNEILGEPAVLGAMNTALAGSGYSATGMSCEKVLVSGKDTKAYEPDWTPRGKRVPFDAMCWLVIAAPEGDE